MEIKEPGKIFITLVSMDSASCNQSDGALKIKVNSQAIKPLNFEWNIRTHSNIDNYEDTLLNIPSGTYTITVTDNKGCTADSAFAVVDQNSPVAVMDSVTNPLCWGSNDGKAYASATGGATPYKWNWVSDSTTVSSTSDNATNLDGGNVYVTVTDQNGCKSSASGTLFENPELKISITTEDIKCNGDSTGSASVSTIGGTGLGTYTYTWKGASYDGASPSYSTDSLLTAQTYTLEVKDANGCTKNENNIVINQPTKLQLSSNTDPVKCHGDNTGSASVTASNGTPGYTYTWSNFQSTDTAKNLTAGTYTVTVTDNNDCKETSNMIVTEPTAFVFDSIPTKDMTCYQEGDANITTYVSGGTSGYSYKYDGPNGFHDTTQTVNNLIDIGNYDIEVRDGNNCKLDTTVIIHQPDSLKSSEITTDESCYHYCDGEVNVTTEGGIGTLTYTWEDILNGPEDRDSLCPGDYKYTVEDSHHCKTTGEFTINGHAELSVIEDSVKNTTCGDCNGEIVVKINGGVPSYSLAWTQGNATCGYPDGGTHLKETGLGQGVHTVEVTDGEGCKASLDIAISNLTGAKIDSLTLTHNLCNGDQKGKIIAHVSGGTPPLTFTWNPTGGTVTNDSIYENLVAGNYNLNVADSAGCADTKTNIIITEPTLLTSNIEEIVDVSCNGYDDGTIKAKATGGTSPYTYLWNDPLAQTTDLADTLKAGSYTVTITDANNCTTNTSGTVNEPAPLNITSTINNVSCGGWADG